MAKSLSRQLRDLHKTVVTNTGTSRCAQCNPEFGLPCPTVQLLLDHAKTANTVLCEVTND